MSDQRYSDNDVSRRDIPSFIEPKPPLILNPFLRPRPQKGIKLFEEPDVEKPELVQVFLRLKPCNVPNNLYEVRSDQSIITQHNGSKMYTFSKIFRAECSQNEIFEVVVKDNLKKLPEGHNFTLLTYGPSGSGKTFTLMGTVGAPGLVPRSLEYVFKLVDASQQPIYKPAENGADKLSYAEQDFELQWVKKLRQNSGTFREKYRRVSVRLQNEFSTSSLNLSNRTKYYVWVSFVEIYNEAIYDLLAPPEKRTKLHIREDSSGLAYVKGAAQAFVRSGEEAFDVMAAGKRNLVVAATGVHAHSSRSHCIFTITMLTETDGEVRSSCVRLCDLAGCERARATRNTGARMQESRAINSSLHVLERCLHMLRRNQKHGQDSIVPYRESKLTRLLGSSLSGSRGEAVSMVVTLNPSPQFASETKSVLGFANVAHDIQINSTIPSVSSLESLNSTGDTTIETNMEIMKLRADNERLHFELMQAESHISELLLTMDEQKREASELMKELVDKTKKNTTEYYEFQLESLRSEMEDMKEEYEEKLEQTESRLKSNGTPARMQAKVDELMTENMQIKTLQEELAKERIARKRAEKEVKRLLNYIEERNEKDVKESSAKGQDVVTISDDEIGSGEDSDDSLNESLDPMIIMSKAMNTSKNVVNLKTKGSIEEDVLHCNNNKEISPNNSYITNETCNDSIKSNNTLQDNDNLESTHESFHDKSALARGIGHPKQSLLADSLSQSSFDDKEKLGDGLENPNKSLLIKSIRIENRNRTSDNFCQLTFDDENLINKSSITLSNKDSQLIKSIVSAKDSITVDDFSKLTFDDENLSDTAIKGKDSNIVPNKNDSQLIKSLCGARHSITDEDFSKLTFDDEKLTYTHSTYKTVNTASNKDDSQLIKSMCDTRHCSTVNNFSKLTFDDEKLIGINVTDRTLNTASNKNDSQIIKSICDARHSITVDDFSKLTFDDEKLINTAVTDKALNTTSNKDDSQIIKSICGEKHCITVDHFSKLTFDNEEKFADKHSTNSDNVKTLSKDQCILSKSTRDIIHDTTNYISQPILRDDNLLTHALSQKDTAMVTNSNPVCLGSIKIEKNSTKTDTSGECSSTNIPPTASSTANLFNYQNDDINDIKPNSTKGTYFVKKSQDDLTKSLKEVIPSLPCVQKNDSNTEKHLYKCEVETKIDYKTKTKPQKVKNIVESFESKYEKGAHVDSTFKRPNERMFINKLIKNLQTSLSSDSSLLQFEQLEVATKEFESTEAKISFGDINVLKKNKKFFDFDEKSSNVEKSETDKNKLHVVNKSPSPVPTIPHLDNLKLCSQLIKKEETDSKKSNEDTLINPTFPKEINNKMAPDHNIYVDLKSAYNETTSNQGHNQIVIKTNHSISAITNLDSQSDFNKEERSIKTNKTSGYCDIIKSENLTNTKLFLNVKHNSMDIFERFSPCPKNNANIESVQVEKEKLIVNIKPEKNNSLIKEFPMTPNDISPANDTINVFEDIYKNISSARVTDFELLVTDSSTNDNVDNEFLNDKNNEDKALILSPKQEKIAESSCDVKQINKKTHTNDYVKEINGNKITKDVLQDELSEVKHQVNEVHENQAPKPIETLNDLHEKCSDDNKYNLRKRAFAKMKDQPVIEEDAIINTCKQPSKENANEDVPQNVPKTEKPRRPTLRLRRRKNQEQEDVDVKLKDIVNLQTEFSDVTLDKPATARKVKDIPSPEGNGENLPPSSDIQSCPSKLLTRSRRKLFTPRADVLEELEKEGQCGDSNEQVRVPRPSYHRPRARRKL